MRGTPLFCEREFPKIPFTAKTDSLLERSNFWLFTFVQRSVFIVGAVTQINHGLIAKVSYSRSYAKLVKKALPAR